MAKKVIKRGVRPAPRVLLDAQTQTTGKAASVTVEDATISMMLTDPRFTELLPCLASSQTALAQIGKKCARCARARTAYKRNVMAQAKQCVAGAKGDRLARLKQLLHTESVHVITAAGRKIIL